MTLDPRQAGEAAFGAAWDRLTADDLVPKAQLDQALADRDREREALNELRAEWERDVDILKAWHSKWEAAEALADRERARVDDVVELAEAEHDMLHRTEDMLAREREKAENARKEQDRLYCETVALKALADRYREALRKLMGAAMVVDETMTIQALQVMRREIAAARAVLDAGEKNDGIAS